MTTAEYIAIAAILYGAASEVIGLLPTVRENSVVQVVLKVLGVLLGNSKGKR